ncbi:MAG: hypothetical protein RSB59_03805 [Clostridia bacterium]
MKDGMISSAKGRIELIVVSVMPFIATALLVLMQFVKPGVVVIDDTDFWVDFTISAVALLFYYFPFKSLFKKMYQNSTRIIDKKKEYATKATAIYDGNLKNFAVYCDNEFEERKNKFFAKGLQLLDISKAEFVAKYKMSKKLINADKNLSGAQKRMAIELLVKIKFVQKINYEKVLPGISAVTDYNRMKSSMDKSDKLTGVRKFAYAVLITFATVCVSFTTDFTADAVAIITQLVVRLAAGLWQIFSALIAANTLVNKVYFAELSEKSLIMDEFFEECKIDASDSQESKSN